MNEKIEYYYKILGLKPGATLDKIKSAYRRLIKIYHPDRDNSPDSQSMYKEINIAYKALLDQAASNETDINSIINSNYSKMKSQTSDDNYKKAQQANVNSSKETSQASNYGSERAQQSNANNRGTFKQQSAGIFEEFKRDYESKIPFKLQNLPAIFWHSLRELFTDYKSLLAKVCISSIFIALYFRSTHLFTHRIPSGILLVLFHIISLVLFIFFRYYFKPSTWPLSLRISAAIVYGTIITILVACFHQFRVDFILIWLSAALSVSVLISPKEHFRKK